MARSRRPATHAAAATGSSWDDPRHVPGASLASWRPAEQYGGTGRRLERRERRQPFAEPGSAGRQRKAARGVTIEIRPARPEDAAALVEIGAAIGGEREGWLLNTDGWRSVTEERRYLRALRRHPDAAVFVADDGGEIVGRLSVARDPHSASRPRRGPAAQAWSSWSCTSSPGTSPRSSSTRTSGSSARVCGGITIAATAPTSTRS